jgi:hypothetical protein
MKTTEKDGSITPLTFAVNCNYISVTDLAMKIKGKIDEMEKEQERLRMVEEAEKAKVLAKKARLEELRKAREARQKLKEESSVIPNAPIPVVTITEAVIDLPSQVVAVEPPPLEPVGRTRRQVALEVPTNWTDPDDNAPRPTRTRRTRASAEPVIVTDNETL